MRLFQSTLTCCLAVFAGCAGDVDPPPAGQESAAALQPVAAPGMDTAGATSLPSDPPVADFQELLAADWELAPGTEQYLCARKTVAASELVGGWRSLAPAGTHHVLLTFSPEPDGEPDGVTPCDVATLGAQTLWGTGVGTRDRILPEGVAMKLEGGGQLLMNLHLFNATEQTMRGRTGALARSIDAKDVREVADIFQAVLMKINVPPGRSTSSGTCTIDRPWTVFSIAPHMHQTGVAMQVVAHTAQRGDVVLFDGPYSFDNQQAYPLERLQLQAGDTIDFACTYDNTTGSARHFGESSNDEMCNAALARIPAGGPTLCAH